MTRAEVAAAANGVRLRPEDIVAMTVEQIMEDRGVNKGTAYDLRKQATAEVNSKGASVSLAQEILAILKNGHAKDVDALREALVFKDHHASPHDIVKAVWSLQKRALVTFYERKSGRDSIITKIKLTPRGEVETGLRAEHDSAKPDRVKGSRELKRRSPVGKDMTDERNQYHVAKAGPAEVIHSDGEVEIRPATRSLPRWEDRTFRNGGETKPDVQPAAPLNQNERPYVPPDPFEGFPLIKAIYERKRQATKLEAAAESLLEAGELDMASEVLEKVQFTDLEKEILKWLAGDGMA